MAAALAGAGAGGPPLAPPLPPKCGVAAPDSFGGMGLTAELLRGLTAYGFEQPSTTQQSAIMPILSGKDVIVECEPGTGKTAIAMGLSQALG